MIIFRIFAALVQAAFFSRLEVGQEENADATIRLENDNGAGVYFNLPALRIADMVKVFHHDG